MEKVNTVIDARISKTIAFLRLPLVIGVVCVHSQISSPLRGWDWYFVKFFSEEIGRISVPLLFIISGFLFFCNFDRYTYVNKISSRIKSLLLPYFIWNFLAWLFFAGFLHKYNNGVSDFIYSFWNIKSSLSGWFFPVNGALWYLRDLFIISLLSPLVYLWVKHTRWVGMCILLLFFMFNDLAFYSAGLKIAFIFFAIGGYLNNLKWEKELNFSLWNICILFLVYLVMCIFDLKYLAMQSHFFHSLTILVGVLTLFLFFYFLTIRVEISSETLQVCSSLSMFIFVSHIIFLQFFVRLLYRFGFPYLVYYVLLISLTCLFAIIFYFIFRRFQRPFLELLIGGRL